MSSRSTDSTDIPSSNLFKPCLANMPMMVFEKHLITPFTESSLNKDRRRIEIPIIFGVPMIILREKHEIELSMGRSFVEAEVPPRPLMKALVDRLLVNCSSAEDINIMLSRIKPAVIFHAVLELLRRLPEPLLPLSPKGVQIASETTLLEPSHPYGFMIEKELLAEVLRHSADQAEDNTSRFKRAKQKSNDTIQPLIQKYYHCSEPNKQKKTKMLNKFNKSIYHDLHLIADINQRNLVRFIIRNVIYLTRRYCIVGFRRLHEQRNERWPVARITIRPHILQYCYTRMAELVGPVLIGQPKTVDPYPDVERRAMLNILVCGMDRMWLPSQKPHEITVGIESSYCHLNCVCGRGLNVISAQGSRIR
ncbi:hypothetical protein P879_03686 [Paragonimus westermani]|uniref:Uncharacterized protein n=1 Tax=Paragonimus westermani TaxID=34504 RepID=A0A8T0DW22_9TREM|nr:hypothetical protein P879_03686 [Paragonimus westermani]